MEIHRMNGIPPGITDFWMRNPPEEWNSAEITGSWTWIQTGKIKNLPIGNNSWNINSKGSVPRKTNFLKFKYEIFIKMKNNSYPDLLQTSYLSNETIKRTLYSHETIPLHVYFEPV
jgi:hypothetical protein